MKAIDVTDLPEPLAQAVESMVQALRTQIATNGHAEPAQNDSADFDHALDELFAGDSRDLPPVPLTYSRGDIYIDHD